MGDETPAEGEVAVAAPVPVGVVVSDDRTVVRAEMKTIHRTLLVVRIFYWLGVVLDLALLVVVVGFLRGLPDGIDDPELDAVRAMFQVALLLVLVQLAIDGSGALFLRVRPLLMSVLFAGGHTLAFVLGFLDPNPVHLGIQGAFSLLGWVAVYQAARLEALFQRFPELRNPYDRRIRARRRRRQAPDAL